MRFGRYDLVRRVGKGGMSEVFLARPVDGDVGQQALAVKRLLPGLAGDSQVADVFTEEAGIACRIRHSNVIEVYECGEVNGHAFMAMEYIDGIDTWRLVQQSAAQGTPLPPAIAIFVVVEVLKGLAFIHDEENSDSAGERLVHGDVSPSNVFVSREGAVKLGDFGIARRRHREMGVRSSQVDNKVTALAPEQVLGHSYDYRADLFAAGTLLAELLIRESLFARKNQLTTLLAISEARLEQLDRRKDRLPEGIEPILRKALSKSPDDRFESAMAMISALEAHFDKNSADSFVQQLSSTVALSLVGALAQDEPTKHRRDKLSSLPPPGRTKSGSVPPPLPRLGKGRTLKQSSKLSKKRTAPPPLPPQGENASSISRAPSVTPPPLLELDNDDLFTPIPNKMRKGDRSEDEKPSRSPSPPPIVSSEAVDSVEKGEEDEPRELDLLSSAMEIDVTEDFQEVQDLDEADDLIIDEEEAEEAPLEVDDEFDVVEESENLLVEEETPIVEADTAPNSGEQIDTSTAENDIRSSMPARRTEPPPLPPRSKRPSSEHVEPSAEAVESSEEEDDDERQTLNPEQIAQAEMLRDESTADETPAEGDSGEAADDVVRGGAAVRFGAAAPEADAPSEAEFPSLDEIEGDLPVSISPPRSAPQDDEPEITYENWEPTEDLDSLFVDVIEIEEELDGELGLDKASEESESEAEPEAPVPAPADEAAPAPDENIGELGEEIGEASSEIVASDGEICSDETPAVDSLVETEPADATPTPEELDLAEESREIATPTPEELDLAEESREIASPAEALDAHRDDVEESDLIAVEGAKDEPERRRELIFEVASDSVESEQDEPSEGVSGFEEVVEISFAESASETPTPTSEELVAAEDPVIDEAPDEELEIEITVPEPDAETPTPKELEDSEELVIDEAPEEELEIEITVPEPDIETPTPEELEDAEELVIDLASDSEEELEVEITAPEPGIGTPTPEEREDSEDLEVEITAPEPDIGTPTPEEREDSEDLAVEITAPEPDIGTPTPEEREDSEELVVDEAPDEEVEVEFSAMESEVQTPTPGELEDAQELQIGSDAGEPEVATPTPEELEDSEELAVDEARRDQLEVEFTAAGEVVEETDYNEFSDVEEIVIEDAPVDDLDLDFTQAVQDFGEPSTTDALADDTAETPMVEGSTPMEPDTMVPLPSRVPADQVRKAATADRDADEDHLSTPPPSTIDSDEPQEFIFIEETPSPSEPDETEDVGDWGYVDTSDSRPPEPDGSAEFDHMEGVVVIDQGKDEDDLFAGFDDEAAPGDQIEEIVGGAEWSKSPQSPGSIGEPEPRESTEGYSDDESAFDEVFGIEKTDGASVGPEIVEADADLFSSSDDGFFSDSDIEQVVDGHFEAPGASPLPSSFGDLPSSGSHEEPPYESFKEPVETDGASTAPAEALETSDRLEVDGDDEFWGSLGDATPTPKGPVGQVTIQQTNGEEFGPIAFAAALDKVAAAVISPDDLVSMDGSEFLPMSEIPELAKHAPKRRRPIRSVQSVSQRPTPMKVQPSANPAPDKRGLLSDEPVANVLYLLAIDSEHGMVIFDHGPIRKEVYLQGGEALHVASNIASETLGEFLIRQDIISRMELEMAYALQEKFDDSLEETLAGLGLLESSILMRHKGEHIQDMLLDLFTWSKGEYRFYRGRTPEIASASVGIKALPLLCRGLARAVDYQDAKIWWEQRKSNVVHPIEGLFDELQMLDLPPTAAQTMRALQSPTRLEFLTTPPESGEDRAFYDSVLALMLAEVVRLIELTAPGA